MRFKCRYINIFTKNCKVYGKFMHLNLLKYYESLKIFKTSKLIKKVYRLATILPLFSQPNNKCTPQFFKKYRPIKYQKKVSSGKNLSLIFHY